MKTNFFQQIAGLGFNGNYLLNIHQDETGVQTVSVVLKKEKAVTGLPPMIFKATAEELDERFFEELAKPVQQTVGLITNIESYQKELEKAKKNAKPDKDKTAKAIATEQDEDDKEDENNLFTPPEDDKQAKAEKKRLYDETMEKVKELAQHTKYAEALANLPDVADYPDKAEAIEAKRKNLQAGKEAYDKLTASFND
ncbi:PRTRC system protein E [Mucilaginibacter ginsenosidivorax]|uniref:PRTRC system protein E n=1 Tax=Mucilaginibacter ginsenosidivorax TaxID=862126 RepID=A0A5B8W459_9SPHI|nr:PRTRC system protein E [Mucilaginibacter ginsenosidivorax]QEC78591.1 PRTRC system protein E [Mucilaginibacter ginsenosidivorax]